MSRRRIVGLAVLAFAIPIGAGTLWLARASAGDDAEAIFALIRVEPGLSFDFGRTPVDLESDRKLLQTQAQLVTSPNVLLAAAASPQVRDLALVRASPDVLAVLREHLVVEVPPDTNLIRIEARGLPPNDSAVLVNTVVENFRKASSEWSDSMIGPSIAMLDDYLKDLDEDIQLAADRSALAEVRSVALPGGNLSVGLDVAKDDLRDCLQRLRSIRLEAAAAPADRQEGLAAQESRLAAEAAGLAEAIAAADDGGTSARRARAELEDLEARRRNVQERLEFLNFRQLSGIGLQVIAEARVP